VALIVSISFYQVIPVVVGVGCLAVALTMVTGCFLYWSDKVQRSRVFALILFTTLLSIGLAGLVTSDYGLIAIFTPTITILTTAVQSFCCACCRKNND
jgi:hypothetical protein